jgi:NAD(P)-dependent dehydrogenase (short-subunit alcohol dehydrogenase family)
MSYWDGKRALIIGGSAGLGRALADVLGQYGARLAIVGRNQPRLDTATDSLKAFGADVFNVAADVTIDADIERLFNTIKDAWGGVDILCHCAGRSMRGTMLATPADEFRALWETNFLSAVRCIQQFASPLMGSRGHVVLIGSLASKVAAGYLGAYPASKFPLAALAQQLRLETEQRGLHTLLVCPGPIEREDEFASGVRYASQTPEVPAVAHQPGGGAKMRAINPHWLAGKILHACEKRRAELVVPKRARLLFAVSQLSPRFGDWLLRRMTSG